MAGMHVLCRPPARPASQQACIKGVLSSVMLLLQLLSSAEAGSKLQLSTAYPNLARRFEQELGTLSDVRPASMLLRSTFISAISWLSGHHGRCCLVHPAIWCNLVH